VKTGLGWKYYFIFSLEEREAKSSGFLKKRREGHTPQCGKRRAKKLSFRKEVGPPKGMGKERQVEAKKVEKKGNQASNLI